LQVSASGQKTVIMAGVSSIAPCAV